jgi:hypothetical protein
VICFRGNYFGRKGCFVFKMQSDCCIGNGRLGAWYLVVQLGSMKSCCLVMLAPLFLSKEPISEAVGNSRLEGRYFRPQYSEVDAIFRMQSNYPILGSGSRTSLDRLNANRFTDLWPSSSPAFHCSFLNYPPLSSVTNFQQLRISFTVTRC